MFVSDSVGTPDEYTKDEQSRIRRNSGAIRAAESFTSAAAAPGLAERSLWHQARRSGADWPSSIRSNGLSSAFGGLLPKPDIRNRSASGVVPASGAEPLSGAKTGRGRSAIRGSDRDAGIIVNSLEGHPLEGQGIQRSRFGNLNCSGHSEVVGDLTSSTFGLMNVRLKTPFRRVRQ